MKSSKFFVKSNYIKNAKNSWIYCNGRLLCHQNITFLHLKSFNLDGSSSDNISESGSNFSGFSSLSRMQQYRYSLKGKFDHLNVLCNLGEFKSCEIKTVNFNSVNKFAIKLIPSGFLSHKKLYLLPDLEDLLTEWCGLLTGYITKTLDFPSVNTIPTDQRSKSISLNNEVKRNIEKSNTMSMSNEIYIALDENDAYEASDQTEYHLVYVEQSEDAIKFHLQGSYLLKVGVDALELLKTTNRETLHTFPYSAIRRYGAKDSMFRLEAGRYCSTGHGSFTFHIKEAVAIYEKVKERARQNKLKNSLTQSRNTDCETEPKRDSSIDISEPNIVVSSVKRDDSEDDCTDGVASLNLIREEGQTDNDFDTNSSSNIVNEENDGPCTSGLTLEKESSTESIHGQLPDPEAEVILTTVDQDDVVEIAVEDCTLYMEPVPLSVYPHQDNEMTCDETLQISSMDPATEEFRSISPCKERPSHILTDYKVSESTFFKYRQLIKNPHQESSPCTLPTATISEPIQVDFPGSNRSPPPLLPKPKLKPLDGNFDQKGYREFEEMLKDLQLSLG